MQNSMPFVSFVDFIYITCVCADFISGEMGIPPATYLPPATVALVAVEVGRGLDS